MDKPFKTHRQQLAILRSRNMIIANGSKAMRVLETDGYYNVINGYKDIFIDATLTKAAGEDVYKQGTTFEYVYGLYSFDRNIRAILMRYCLLMEASLKAKIAYHFSSAYKQNFSYLDINNFDGSNPKSVTKLISTLSSVITTNTDQTTNNKQFYHYLDKHKELPLWVLVTKMTLGNTIHFYYNMKPSEKQKVINDFVAAYERDYKTKINLSLVQQEAIVSNMFGFIGAFRNYCAHQERIYNVVEKRKGKIYNITHFHKSVPLTFQSKVFDCIVILGLFLTKRDYSTLVKQVISEIDHLSCILPAATFNKVLMLMGFSKNWKTDLKLV